MRRARWLVATAGLWLAADAGGMQALAEDPQILASSCSGCHTSDDTLATSIPKIRGLPETFFVQAMQAFRAGQRPATVMNRIAKGFTDDEIKQLAAYFSAQK